MANATFKCPVCHGTQVVSFIPGKPCACTCDKCNIAMSRVWKNIEANPVDKDMVAVGQSMLKSGMANGKDKIVF